MNNEQFSQTRDLIAQDFELETTEALPSEQELLLMLADQIAYMIEHRMEHLLSLMYRLDIEEAKVNFALSPLSPDPPAMALASLVLERQKKRVFTKSTYKTPPLDDDAW